MAQLKNTSISGNLNITGNISIGASKLDLTMLNLIYPIGTLYWSSKNTNPGTLFGGTWTQIKDKFILAAGDTYKNGNIGGSAFYTLTKNNIPLHSHTFVPKGSVSSTFTASPNQSTGSVGNHNHSGTTNDGGAYKKYPSIYNNETLEEVQCGNWWGGQDPGYGVDLKQMSDKRAALYTVIDIPNHTHNFTTGDAGEHSHTFVPKGSVSSTFTASPNQSTGNYGNSSPTAVSTMPPYVVKYCWERTN